MRRLILLPLLILMAASSTTQPTTQLFAPQTRVLFQGDSITDMNRGRTADPNHILGHSYAFLIAARYGADHPEDQITFINRGISGNTVADLAKRWQADALDQKPDVLSILIGVNDLNRGVSAQDYESRYDKLLADTVAALPNVKLILLEPFALPTGAKKEGYADYRKKIEERQAIVAKLAEKYHAKRVKLQTVFDAAAQRAAPETWVWDGVHPTYAGQQLIADAWMKTWSEFP